MLNATARSEIVPGTDYSLKRKYMIVGTLKNFLASAGVEQSLFIDEFADKVYFPGMYHWGTDFLCMLERSRYLEDID